MRTLPIPFSALLVLMALLGAACLGPAPQAEPDRTIKVFASGLVNPRGLAFGPDGALYVAEAGNGGDRLVEVGAPKPHALGRSGRVSRLGPNGQRTTVVEGLPSR